MFIFGNKHCQILKNASARAGFRGISGPKWALKRPKTGVKKKSENVGFRIFLMRFGDQNEEISCSDLAFYRGSFCWVPLWVPPSQKLRKAKSGKSRSWFVIRLRQGIY